MRQSVLILNLVYLCSPGPHGFETDANLVNGSVCLVHRCEAVSVLELGFVFACLLSVLDKLHTSVALSAG